MKTNYRSNKNAQKNRIDVHHICRACYNGPLTDDGYANKTLECHYLMIQFLIDKLLIHKI